MSKKYLEARRRALLERPRKAREFLEALKTALGTRASIIVFGGRALLGIEAAEPRDLDLLIVVRDDDDPEQVEELVYRLRPKGLPVDVIVARLSELLESSVARQMLEKRIVVHDPLGVEAELGRRQRSRG